MAVEEVLILFTILITLATIVIGASSMRIIHPNECGILFVLGRPRRILYPGLNLVPAIISRVTRIKMDGPEWKQELYRYRTSQNSGFSREVDKFELDSIKHYGPIIKSRRGGQISISCPNCHKIVKINLDDYI